MNNTYKDYWLLMEFLWFLQKINRFWQVLAPLKGYCLVTYRVIYRQKLKASQCIEGMGVTQLTVLPLSKRNATFQRCHITFQWLSLHKIKKNEPWAKNKEFSIKIKFIVIYVLDSSLIFYLLLNNWIYLLNEKILLEYF